MINKSKMKNLQLMHEKKKTHTLLNRKWYIKTNEGRKEKSLRKKKQYY